MTTSETVSNNFLGELLTLQQDGSRAISAPTNWTMSAPLLEVQTGIDDVIDEIRVKILQDGKRNDTACWQFFIGSPGNGKSTAMGKLCKGLEELGCLVLCEDGTPLADLEPSAIPYAIFIREPGNRYASAKIVQDASVVPNPFSPNVDPARELLTTLEDAWDDAMSLVVCTNRGVLEKAHRDRHMDDSVNKEPWFKILAALVQPSSQQSGTIEPEFTFEPKKNARFSKVKVRYYSLDTRSLLLGIDTFDLLVQQAKLSENWACCEDCLTKGMCPFKANRDLLANRDARDKVLTLFRRAELYDGQVIVFREALALISLFLAGCPRDYVDTDPCGWVRARVADHDVFALACRRIYMDIFASSSPYGLEPMEELRQKQYEALRDLHERIRDRPGDTSTAIRHVVEGKPPSIDVGTKRLLSGDGPIAKLDPWCEPLPAEFYNYWDSSNAALLESEDVYLTGIEHACLHVWKALEEGLEQAADYKVPEIYFALKRWSSNFLLHLGALREGRTAWAEELKDFEELLSLMAKTERSIEERRRVRDMNAKLERLLNAGATEGETSTVKLSDNVMLGGGWVRDHLKPSMVSDEVSGSLSLAIRFPEGERAVFAAPVYLWLTRRISGKLDERCFPQTLITGVADARARAASKGEYARADNDVELVVEADSDKRFRLARFDAEVDVSYE